MGMIDKGGVNDTENAVHSPDTVARWATLKTTIQQPWDQWPYYMTIQNRFGKADKQYQNINMSTMLTGGSTGATTMFGFEIDPTTGLPVSKQVPGCQRWDYFDDPQGKRAIHLYFNPKTGQLIGVKWFESGPRKIGPPR